MTPAEVEKIVDERIAAGGYLKARDFLDYLALGFEQGEPGAAFADALGNPIAVPPAQVAAYVTKKVTEAMGQVGGGPVVQAVIKPGTIFTAEVR